MPTLLRYGMNTSELLLFGNSVIRKPLWSACSIMRRLFGWYAEPTEYKVRNVPTESGWSYWIQNARVKLLASFIRNGIVCAARLDLVSSLKCRS